MAIIDPAPESFNHCFAVVNRVKYHYIDEGDPKGTPLILYHGFPDLWYGWRHQIVFLKEHGYRVIVPSLRGYNRTEPGTELEDFALRKVSNDAMALLTELGIERAIVIGHDWGGALAWRTVLHHPRRVIAVASLCTPYIPPSREYTDIHEMVKILPNFSYQIYLNDEKCIPELDADPERFFNVIYRQYNEGSRGFRSWWDKETFPQTKLMSPEALQYYVDNYRQVGFRGPTSWYRTRKINFEDEFGVDPNIPHPSLMLLARNDHALPPSMANKMPGFFRDLDMKIIEDCGHWILMEQKDRINAELLTFIQRVVAEGDKWRSHI